MLSLDTGTDELVHVHVCVFKDLLINELKNFSDPLICSKVGGAYSHVQIIKWICNVNRNHCIPMTVAPLFTFCHCYYYYL